MKLAEIIAEAEAPYVKTQKRNCLVLQAALSHEWETQIQPPDTPIDTDTGEIFPWTVIAVNEDDKNIMRFKVSVFHVSNSFGWQSSSIDNDDALKDEFDEWYVGALNQEVENFSWKFDNDLETYLKSTVMKHSRDVGAAFMELASTICDSFIEEWRDHNKASSHKALRDLTLVNSKQLEDKLAAEIKAFFLERFNEQLKKDFPNEPAYKPA